MSSRLTLILVAVNLALLAVLGWQWLSPAGQRSTHWSPPSAIAPQLGAGSSEVQAGQGSDAAALAAVLERPVFAVTRRPLPPPTAAASMPVAAPPDPLDNVHIFGIFSGSEGGGLIVRADGKTRRLKVSESLGGWRLQEIRGVDAVFVRSGQSRVVSLVQAKPGTGAPPALPSARPSPPSTSLTPQAPPLPPRSEVQTPIPPTPAARPAARAPAAGPSPFVVGGSR